MSRLNGNRDEARKLGWKVNVGILGAGHIAQKMAHTLTLMQSDVRYASLVAPYAVASREGAHAEQFAQQFGIAHAYDSYERMLQDPLVDLVYIATPHVFHASQALQCLAHGKNVLVEKSFTANTLQAREVLQAAEQAGLLCAEAMWTRYLPARAALNQLIESGAIGAVQAMSANLCYPVSHKLRLTDPRLAGGALLDLGVYPLNFIDMVLSGATVQRVSTSVQMYHTGVDAQSSTTLYYDNQVMAVATCSMLAAADRSGAVYGTQGYIMADNINDITALDVYNATHERVQHLDMPRQLTGFEYEVAAAAQAILDGATQTDAMTHADTLRMMELMDQIRGMWGMQFPFETH